MVGKKFNRLTVIGEDTEKYKLTGRYYSICKCDCGNIVSSPSTLIRAGISKSCGCYRKEKFEQDKKKADRKKSFFEINGDIAYLHLTNSDKVAIIDVDDIEKVNICNWGLSNRGYVKVTHKRKSMEFTMLQHFIVGKKEGFVVDHINQNKLDNRKCNLRFVTIMDNSNNNLMTIPKSNSNCKYITYLPYGDVFVVRYTRNKKTYYVGRFKELDEAKTKLKESLIKNNFKELLKWVD